MGAIDFILKAKEASPPGTEKTWGGKVYVKQPNGKWRPKKKGGEKAKDETKETKAKDIEVGQTVKLKGAEEEDFEVTRIEGDRYYIKQGNKPEEWVKREDLDNGSGTYGQGENEMDKFAEGASEKQLRAAIDDPNQPEEVKAAARRALKGKEGESSNSNEENTSENFNLDDVLSSYNSAEDDDEKLKYLKQAQNLINKKFKEIESQKEKKKADVHNVKEELQKEIQSVKKELSEELDKKIEEMKPKQKQIKKTGIMVGGKKIFITMEDNKYIANGGGLKKFESLPDQDLDSFKQQVKNTVAQLGNQSTTESEKISDSTEPSLDDNTKGDIQQFLADAYGTFSVKSDGQIADMVNELNEVFFNSEGSKKELNQVFDFIKETYGHKYSEKEKFANKLTSSEKEKFEEINKSYLPFVNKDDYKEALEYYNEKVRKFGPDDDHVIRTFLSDAGQAFSLEYQLAANEILLKNNRQPILFPYVMQNYQGQDYITYDNFEWGIPPEDDEDSVYESHFFNNKGITKEQSTAIASYTTNGFRPVRDVLTRGIDRTNKGAKAVYESTIDPLSGFIDEHKLQEHVIFSRRIEIEDSADFDVFTKGKPGDIFEDKSFTSFSLSQLESFGEFQITLMGKPGDALAAVGGQWYESEFVAQKGSKYKILARGTNSIVVELV